jgi:ABC-type dipeptide/oligopeptide/nickel transport system permease component
MRCAAKHPVGRALQLWRRLPRVARIVLARLFVLPPQMLGVTLVTFLLVRMLPGDPALLLLGRMASPETVRMLRNKLGLDASLYEQFISYVGATLHGDLGVSPFTSNPVALDLIQRAPATLELICYAMPLTMLIGVSVAVIGVVRRGGLVDRGIAAYGTTAGSIPDFCVGLLLIFFLFHKLGWAPAPFGRLDVVLTPPPTRTGFYTVDSLIVGDWGTFRSSVAHLALPVLTITIANVGAVIKLTRAAFAESYGSAFVVHARACGLSQRQLTMIALRNSLGPIISLAGFLTGFLLGAAVLVETLFAWGGLGQYAVQAVVNSDYSALQGFVLLASVFILLVYLVADILYEFADPRIRV